MNERLEIKAALAVTDAGEITGTAWIFADEDRVGDVITKGAITSPQRLPMLFSHDQSQVVGVWDEITETDTGLTVKGRLLIEEVERAREVRAMIRAGAVTGLSIGFVTKNATRKARGRTISALELHEISVVAIPAHRGAQITSYKSVIHEESKMEIETETQAPALDTKALEEVKTRLGALEAKANRPGVAAIAPVNVEKKAFGSFLRLGNERMDDTERKSLNVANDAQGGFLAPEEFGSELIKLLTEFSPVRQYARVMTVNASEIIMPRRVSGAAATWTDEGADMTASEPTFEQVKIANHELSTFVVASNKLIEDNAYNLEGELLADFAESFGRAEGLAFVKGSGNGQPRGLMTAAGIQTMNSGLAGGFPAANPADMLISMYHRIPSAHAQKAVWLMNRTTLAEVRKWKDAQGRYLVIDPQDGAPSLLLGRPVVEMPDMDNIAANNFPIMFGDLAGYRIVDRIGLTVMRDPFTLGSKSQVRFIARKRVGADLTHPDRFVKLRIAA